MNKQNKSHRVLGIMSGTSLDGLDFCLSDFYFQNNQWNFTIIEATTFNYSKQWETKLKEAENLSGEKLIQLHFEYGKYIGDKAREFIDQFQLKTDLIASHGHTIFHQIDKGFTFQLGHGASIAAASTLTTVSDFRSLDVALGGQGAPLVPFGEKALFPNHSIFMNFGGICNITFVEGDKISAFDICPFNMVLNFICQKEFNTYFDKGGKISQSGKLNSELLKKLNALNYYHQKPPKSLGKEWVYKEVIPLLNESNVSPTDQLFTFSQHIADQIHKAISSTKKEVLITGGGAKNQFILDLLQAKKIKLQVPEEKIIDFKEALIFGFLGLKRFLNETNTLKSVTGSSKDNSGGTIFLS